MPKTHPIWEAIAVFLRPQIHSTLIERDQLLLLKCLMALECRGGGMVGYISMLNKSPIHSPAVKIGRKFWGSFEFWGLDGITALVFSRSSRGEPRRAKRGGASIRASVQPIDMHSRIPSVLQD